MSKFNESTHGVNTTTNHEGEVAYTLSPKLELYSAVVATMMSNKFYESETDLLQRIRRLVQTVGKTEPVFVAKLAVYARNQMNLRSVPLVLIVELAKIHCGDDLVSRTIGKVINRVDEITELAAYYAVTNGAGSTKPLSKLSCQIKKGLGEAFNRFDAYQFAKYNRGGKIKLRDVLFLTHPKAKDFNQQEVFNQIASNTLPTPETWEVGLSKGGEKKAVWEKMIDSKKLGYMATLRNLRNMLEAEISMEHWSQVIGFITDPEQVRKSKQFPFRYLSAYQELRGVKNVDTPQVMEALNAAISVATENIKGFDKDERVYVSVDTSGSMSSGASVRSKMCYQDIGLVMAMLLRQVTPRIETSIFGTTLEGVNLTKGNILGNVDSLRQYSDKVGSSTNGYLIPKDLLARKIVMDKVVVFTDCQLYQDYHERYWGTDQSDFNKLWAQYRKEVAPNAKLYIFDLAGYGNTPVSVQSNGVYLIAGWSEKVFDMLDAYEQGSTALKQIESIAL